MSDNIPRHNADECLDDVEVQLLADEQPLAHGAEHVKNCDRCAARVAERGRLMDGVAAATAEIEMSPSRAAILKRQLLDAGSGSTTLRAGHAGGRSRWIAIGSAVAATLVLVAIVPRLNRTETLSASEILDRSHAALTSTVSGIETLTYDLALEGVLAQLLPEEQSGRFTVEEVTDHDHPGRFRILKLAADGTPVGGAVEDPVAGQRIRYIRLQGHGYLLKFSAAQPLPLSLAAAKRAALQSFVMLMQRHHQPTVAEGWRAGERVFIVDIAQAEGPSSAAPFALSRGRAVIAADDARLLEVDAAGTIADQPFSISFMLRERRLHAGPAAPGQFDIPTQPGDVVLAGAAASTNPMWDVVTRALHGAEEREGRR